MTTYKRRQRSSLTIASKRRWDRNKALFARARRQVLIKEPQLLSNRKNNYYIIKTAARRSIRSSNLACMRRSLS